jgi:hypothetical protein
MPEYTLVLCVVYLRPVLRALSLEVRIEFLGDQPSIFFGSSDSVITIDIHALHVLELKSGWTIGPFRLCVDFSAFKFVLGNLCSEGQASPKILLCRKRVSLLTVFFHPPNLSSSE